MHILLPSRHARGMSLLRADQTVSVPTGSAPVHPLTQAVTSPEAPSFVPVPSHLCQARHQNHRVLDQALAWFDSATDWLGELGAVLGKGLVGLLLLWAVASLLLHLAVGEVPTLSLTPVDWPTQLTLG